MKKQQGCRVALVLVVLAWLPVVVSAGESCSCPR